MIFEVIVTLGLIALILLLVSLNESQIQENKFIGKTNTILLRMLDELEFKNNEVKIKVKRIKK